PRRRGRRRHPGIEARVKHARAEALDALEPFLAVIRRRLALREKVRGVFYRGATPLLHFHEDPAGLFGDLKVGSAWRRFPVNTHTEQRALLAELAGAVPASPPAPRARRKT
ncbi:MAG TPA: hypothetical protein VML54_14475, partial [Candidatus Limnocylindrales bacterium]|nr:hypothetical protein [Candidatus Limnocylindrales bacterium]